MGLDARLVITGYVVIVAIGFLDMLILEWNGMLAGGSGPNRVLAAGFQAIAGRTSGFSTVNWEDANSGTQFVWLALTMAGGASGSTAGGVKIATFAIVFVAVLSTFRGEDETQVFERRVTTPLLMRAMSVIAAFLLIHFARTLLLAYTEFSLAETDAELIDLLFESMSGLATVGLSTGITKDMSDLGKVPLCALMFVGRLGPLTLGYALQMRVHPRR